MSERARPRFMSEGDDKNYGEVVERKSRSRSPSPVKYRKRSRSPPRHRERDRKRDKKYITNQRADGKFSIRCLSDKCREKHRGYKLDCTEAKMVPTSEGILTTFTVYCGECRRTYSLNMENDGANLVLYYV